MNILPIVEGQGDNEAVPILLRQILYERGEFETKILTPHIRGDLHRVRKHLPRILAMAFKEQAAVLILQDIDSANSKCVVVESTQIHAEIDKNYCPYPVKCCFFQQEYESLFLAERKSAIKCLDLSQGTVFPQNPEHVRDAKGWLSRAMQRGYSYKPTVDQARITANLDLGVLRLDSPSFRHLEDTVICLSQII